MPATVQPEKQRRFALEVVATLRRAGYEAYWAGGCVRDELLGRTPKDYDVATNALPDEIRRVFRHRKTLAVGAAFGVITIVGRAGEGQIEVATFRRDDTYSDGRHPDRVHFSTAEEDAKRRDFTINGLFLDPLENRVIDYVGGQEDLRQGIIRAIGNPRERFAEDKLRMLRAVRFAASFGFSIDSETFAAIKEMAPQIVQVSPERIAAELERCLVEPGRRQAAELLLASGLLEVILPELASAIVHNPVAWAENLSVAEKLEQPTFALALAVLYWRLIKPEDSEQVARRLRFSNQVRLTTAWLLHWRYMLTEAPQRLWSEVHPIASSPYIRELLAWGEALVAAGRMDPEIMRWWREKLAQPRELWDPAPLVSGIDLQTLGIPPGPIYRRILSEIRRRQLDGQLTTKEEAIDFARSQLATQGDR
ncbi:MAG: CCA tRNA nucleotidyltransferase [Thermoguttaceae bacterium]|nr:CCA tRNA nucleotidyltransferase [Thermoguttaceae bacterium]MDW8079077.1 CCA tRNA nucleotidyltransferase [Thermoguttaceae bacterium]